MKKHWVRNRMIYLWRQLIMGLWPAKTPTAFEINSIASVASTCVLV
jgi:hypothetical protein